MRYIASPEFFWFLFYLVARLTARLNRDKAGELDSVIENAWFYVPLFVMLTFSLYWIPAAPKTWLLLRIWLTGILMGHVVLNTLMTAYSEQGPGIGMGYLAGILFILIVLIAGSLYVTIFL